MKDPFVLLDDLAEQLDTAFNNLEDHARALTITQQEESVMSWCARIRRDAEYALSLLGEKVAGTAASDCLTECHHVIRKLEVFSDDFAEKLDALTLNHPAGIKTAAKRVICHCKGIRSIADEAFLLLREIAAQPAAWLMTIGEAKFLEVLEAVAHYQRAIHRRDAIKEVQFLVSLAKVARCRMEKLRTLFVPPHSRTHVRDRFRFSCGLPGETEAALDTNLKSAE